MLRKATLLCALFVFAVSLTANAQERIQFGDNDKVIDKAALLPDYNPDLQAIKKNLFPDGIIPGGYAGYPPSLLPEPITENLQYQAWADTSDTSFTVPNARNPEGNRRIICVADLPRGRGEATGLGFRMLGYMQAFPALNASDPNATIAIDSVFFWLFRPGGAFPPSRPGISTDWALIPLYLNEENKDINMFVRQVDRFTLDIFNDFVFTEVNDFAGYFPIPKETINAALEVDFRGDIISLSGITVPTPELVLPADRPFIFILAPQNWDGDFAKNEQDTIRLLGTFEWGLQDRGEQTLGGMFRRGVDANDAFLPFSDSTMLFWPNLIWPTAGNEDYPSISGVRIRQNYDIVWWGTYTGEPRRVSVKEDDRPATAFTLGNNYPNPVHGVTNIPFSIVEPSAISMRITNILGQVVFESYEPHLNAGSYIIDVDAGTFTEGTYIYTLSNGKQTLSGKMTVAR